MNQKQIDEIRSFNRFYTIIIGLLDRYILSNRFTLTEVRILFELYHKDEMTASDLISYLHVDKGYLSRILKQLEKKKLITKTRSRNDKRSSHLTLTQLGKSEFMILNQAANDQIIGILNQLSDDECTQLTNNMRAIKNILIKVQN